MRGERRGREQQDDPTRREGRAGGPQRTDAERERRPEDVRQLDDGRLEGVGGAHGAGIGEEGWKLGSQAGADRGFGQPDAGREREQDGERSAHRLHRDRDQQRSGHGGAGQQHRGLSTPVDELPEQWPADADRDRVDAGDHASRGERAGQVLGMDQQPDAEHRQRQPREDRGDEQASYAGG